VYDMVPRLFDEDTGFLNSQVTDSQALDGLAKEEEMGSKYGLGMNLFFLFLFGRTLTTL